MTGKYINGEEIPTKRGVFAYLGTPTNTTCTLADTWYAIAGAFTNSPMDEFIFDTDHLEYTGTNPRYFEIDWHATCSGDSNGVTIHYGIYVNGSQYNTIIDNINLD